MNISIEQRTKQDLALLTDFIAEDGAIPPIIFVHFKKTNRKIANMMNEIPSGHVPVKQGFLIALSDPLLAEGRHAFMLAAGKIFATMKLLGILEEPESIVFCSEAWASKQAKIAPAEDPESKDVFVSFGQNFTGENYFSIHDKKVRSETVDGEIKLITEVAPMTGEDDSMVEDATRTSPLVDTFFEAYHAAIKEQTETGDYKQFQDIALEDPVETFSQGMEAAFMVARIATLRGQ